MLFEHVDKMAAALDGFALKHQVIANNLANVNTPGYQRVDVSFGSVLEDLFADEPAAAPMAENGTFNRRKATSDLNNGFMQTNYQFDEVWGQMGPVESAPAAFDMEPQPTMKRLMAQTPGVMRLDGNGVSVEREVGEMVRNSMMYNLFSQKASGSIKTLKEIIQAR